MILTSPLEDHILEDPQWMRSMAMWLARRPAGPMRTAALRELTADLTAHAERAILESRIRTFVSHPSQVRLLTEMGLPDHPNFLREVLQRLTDRVIPRLEDDRDLYAFLDQLSPDEEDAEWVKNLPEDLAGYWGRLLGPSERAYRDAAELLAIHAASRGLRRDFLRLGPEYGEREKDSPFALLVDAVKSDDGFLFTAVLEKCRQRLRASARAMEAGGVSSDLAYRMDFIEAGLQRIELLWDMGHAQEDGRFLAAELLAGASRQRRLGEIFKASLSRLARKMVEHTGRTGEHYLVRNGAEFRQMALASAGGGALTALTAFGKFTLGFLAIAPGLMGLAHAANYAGSFILMQFLHFTLASKQPAATAAALSAALETSETQEDEIEIIKAITSGQFIATLGNVCVAIPTALLVDALLHLATGHAYLTPDKAHYVLESLHPFKTMTIPFAALTGVLLWIGSLAGGWTSNWMAYRGLCEAIARNHPLKRILGREAARSLGQSVYKHLPGVVTCLVLGFLLGFLPLAAAFLGIPLEVRHVTLSAASVGFSIGGFAPSAGIFPWQPLVWALLGVLVIGAFNVGVSFALSLRLAIQARGLGDKDRRELRRMVLGELLRHPTRFLWPRKKTGVA